MKTLSAALALLLTFHSPANALVATARLATAPRATFGLPPAVPALNAATLAVPLLPAQARFSVLSLQTLVPVAVPAMSPEPLHVARPESALAFPALRSAASAPDDASAQFDGGHVLPAGADASVPLSLPVKTFQLANGLTVVVHTDKSNPVVAVSITYKVGSEHEKPGLSGFAHLFEHLMAQGTKSLKPREISPLIESNGGIRNAYTMRSNTTYHSVVPKSALKTVLWAEAERMSTLNVDARALALEKQVVLEEMRLRVTNSAYARAYDAGMAETAFQRWGNQHTTIGEADDIRNARLEDVRAFYKAHYAPNNAVLALAGDVTEDEARALAQRFFGPLAPREIAPAPDLSEAPMTGETRRVIEDKFARVPRLMAAWRAPQRGSRDYWALTLLGEILGNSEDSPLFRSLVKDAKIALDAGMNIPWWTGPFNPSLGPDLFGLITHTKPGTTTDAVLSLVDTVMAELGAQGPAEGDLAAAKTKLELSWTKDLEQLIGRAQTLSSYAALVGDPANLPRDFAELMSVTASDVRSAIQRWIIGQGRAVVEARPTPDAVLPADVPAPPVPEQEPRAPGDPRPEIDPQRSAPAPALERFTLANGLKVVFARDARLPLLEARLSIPAGRIAERVGEEGLSVAVSELLLQGAEGRDARALSSAFAALGWKLDIDGLPQAVVVKAAGLSRNAGPFFKELAHVLARPAFPGEEVALWKENKVQEMRIRNSRPDFMASERLKAETLGSHPYGRPAVSDGQIAAVSREGALAFSRRAVVPAGATLVLAGDADPAALRAALEDAFQGWSGGEEAAEIPPLPEQADARLVLVNRPGSKQANLTISQAIALQPTDPDYVALLVANQILGGSATSRLFLNLRVAKGFTYGAYSRPTVFEKGLLWTANAEVRNQFAAPALEEMRKEIARMRDELAPAETLEAAKRYLAGIFLIKLSSIDYAADTLAGYERNRQAAERELATYLERLNALTPEDVRRAAQTYWTPDKMATVVVGDEASLRPVLQP